MPTGKEQMSDLIRTARREQIVDAARSLFSERGSLDVSVDEIAHEADLSRTTVYKHFSDREEILRASLARNHQRVIAALDSAVAGVDDAIERLITIFRVVMEQVDENAGFYRLALSLSPTGQGGEAAAVITESLVVSAEVADVFSSAFKDAVAEGRIRDDVSGAALEVFCGHLLAGLISERTRQVNPSPADDAASDAWRFLLEGIGS